MFSKRINLGSAGKGLINIVQAVRVITDHGPEWTYQAKERRIKACGLNLAYYS